MPIRRRLLLLAFSLLIPAMLACALAAVFVYVGERRRAEENLVRATQALAETVDRELDTIVRRLEALATSPSLAQGDLHAFWEQAARAVTEDGLWVVLCTRDGQQVVNTLRPFGTALPRHSFPVNVDHVFTTGRPAVSPLFTGTVSSRSTLAIDVPVRGRDGQVIYSLAMGVLPTALRSVVASESLPKRWLAAAFDTNLSTIARSRDAETFIGKGPSPVLAQAMGVSDSGIVDAVSLEGIPTRVAYGRSPKYGWRFAVGVPKAELAAATERTIALFAALALALLSGGAMLAIRIGHRLSDAVISLVPAARSLGQGDTVIPPHTGVLEVDQVSTALVHAGDALRASTAERALATERAEEILSSITDGFYALDRDWRFTYINTRASQILGKTTDELFGLRLLDIFPQIRGTPVHQNFDQVMSLRQPRQFEAVSAVLKRWIFFSVYPAGDGGIAVYFRDISAQKAAEADLVGAKNEAERANHAKTQFLAAASHDLRQPVQSLFFFHEVLASKLKDHPCGPVVASMRAGLEALKGLLDGLLDMSRLHAGVVEVQPAAFPVAALLTRLESEYAGRAAAQGVTLRVVASTLWIRSDMAQLERILRNLMDNALKYARRGGGVLLGCRRFNGGLRIQVADTGPGIPEDKLEVIFEEFVQLGNSERDRNKGLGLGLAIVRHLGHLLGHPVGVRSRLGHGTVFSVSVPVVKARRTGHPAVVRMQAPAAGPATRGLALIVDDEALVLVGLRSMLESWGWEVLAAESGQEAVRLVSGSSRAPDVILADYRLRGDETGVKVIRDVHGVCALTIPAVVLTGDTGPERIAECRRSGFHLMHKPVDATTLHTVLDHIRTQKSA